MVDSPESDLTWFLLIGIRQGVSLDLIEGKAREVWEKRDNLGITEAWLHGIHWCWQKLQELEEQTDASTTLPDESITTLEVARAFVPLQELASENIISSSISQQVLFDRALKSSRVPVTYDFSFGQTEQTILLQVQKEYEAFCDAFEKQEIADRKYISFETIVTRSNGG